MAESYAQQKTRIEKETRRLIDLIINASSNELAKAYEQRVSELEREKLLIEEKRENLAKKPGSFDELFELAVAFLAKPYDLWASGNLQLQKLVLRLTFADHLVYSPESGFSNAKTTMPFKLLESLKEGKTEMARPKGFEPMPPRFLA